MTGERQSTPLTVPGRGKVQGAMAPEIFVTKIMKGIIFKAAKMIHLAFRIAIHLARMGVTSEKPL